MAFAKWAFDHASSLKRGIKLAFTSFEEVGHGGSSGFRKSRNATKAQNRIEKMKPAALTAAISVTGPVESRRNQLEIV